VFVGVRREMGSARYRVNPVAVADGAGVLDESTTAPEIYVLWRTCAGQAPDIFSSRRHLQPSSRHPAALIDEEQRTYR